MTGLEIAFVLAVITVAAVVQGAVGFGQNALGAPLLALVDTDFIPGPMLVVALFVNILMVIRERKGMVMGDVAWAYVGRLPGTVLGALAVAAWAKSTLAIILAVTVLCAVAINLIGLRLPVNRASLILMGGAAGFTGTSAAIGGPPMALLLQGEDGERLRGTLAGFFTAGVITSIVLLTITGSMDGGDWRMALMLLPASATGFFLSKRLTPYLDRGYTRPAVWTLSAVSALVLLGQTLR